MEFLEDKSTCSSGISKTLEQNLLKIRTDFGNSSDLEIGYFKLDGNQTLLCAYVYIKSLVDKSIINNLSLGLNKLKYELISSKTDINFKTLINFISGLRYLKENFNYDSLYENLLSGNTVFLSEGYDSFFSISTTTDTGRHVGEATSQTIIRGPKEGFTEKIMCNILLIREKIKSKDLRIENLSIGKLTKTTISLIYIDKIAKKEIIEDIRKRLYSIEIDGIFDGGYIEELIKDDKYSIFPTFLNSEKPDAVAGNLLEGKVAILIDGTPYVLTAPGLMVEFFQSSEDYYHSYFVSSVMRFLRYIAFFLTLLTPALYIAITTFHQEMLPTTLLISLAAQREGVPFPAFVEASLMEFTFEILREAGIRMPKAIGPAISIVGALVLGQAAVEAGIVSASMVIVVSITAIASFAIPNYEMSNAIRILRFGFMIASAMFGLYGVIIGLLILLLHLCKIKSMGIPYLTPISPMIDNQNKDTIFRLPLWKMKYRPIYTTGNNKQRLDDATSQKSKDNKKPEFR